jgi:tRNA(Phe) wybutosine-synthesizing methylase Tyw3
VVCDDVAQLVEHGAYNARVVGLITTLVKSMKMYALTTGSCSGRASTKMEKE